MYHPTALEASHGLEPTPKNIQRVAGQVGEEAARWAFTQWELRRRARAKFELADQMLFDRDGLEMATHERLAAYHASRFLEGERVADLTCGIGGDLIAFAKRGPTVGYETDPLRAAYARHNLSVHGLDAEVREEDGRNPEPLDAESAFLDPQRRDSDDPLGHPNPSTMRGLHFKCRLVGVKLGTSLPMSDAACIVFPRVEAVSYGGECRELLSWKGEGVDEGIFAVHVETGSILEAAGFCATTEEPGDYLFHADPAAIKAHCLGALCGAFGLVALGDSDGYLTGDSPIDSPWLRRYRVLWHGSADKKHTQKAIDSLEGRLTEVKTRGVREPADRIRARFDRAGDRPLTLAVWPVGKSVRHALLEVG